MLPIGLILTIAWFTVLFAGSALVSKRQIKNGRAYLVASLIAIPLGYISYWLFT